MTQEEKQLLLKDLCMRIQYRTFVCLSAYNKPETCILTGIDDGEIYLNVDSDPFRINYIRPYLRPMSSMTEEEKELMKGSVICFNELEGNSTLFDEIGLDWLLAHHFDYRGLIEKGLALKAPEGMYKNE